MTQLRDKKFIIDSIKMDLFRVVTAAGDLSQTLPYAHIKDFLDHANKDFDKTTLTPYEQKLRDKLLTKISVLNFLQDPLKRLRWTEDILTIRSQL